MDEVERRKQFILAHWDTLPQATKDLLRSIGIDGDVRHRQKEVQTVLTGGIQ